MTKGSEQFERFWLIWKKTTGRPEDKAVAYRYWKRDKLDAQCDEIICALRKQAAARKRDFAANYWVPRWPFARKWLNNKRYEDEVFEPMQKQKPPEPEIPPEKIITPEQKVEFRKGFDLLKKPDYELPTKQQREERKQKMKQDLERRQNARDKV